MQKEIRIKIKYKHVRRLNISTRYMAIFSSKRRYIDFEKDIKINKLIKSLENYIHSHAIILYACNIGDTQIRKNNKSNKEDI